MKRIVVGISGASGASLAIKVLELLKDIPEAETHLVMTRGAELTFKLESGLPLETVSKLADVVHNNDNLGASIASGSFRVDAMIVVPCSMKTVAGIALGYSDNLLLRAADVTLKEGRPLILAVRESPLSAIHLENMLRLSKIPGVRLMPPLLNRYQGVQTLDELEFQLACRYVDALAFEVPALRRWSGVNT